ncbi:MAG: inositol monophosphatase family protein [Frankiaceae bacterium]
MDDLGLLHALADTADKLTMTRFLAADLRVTTKPDSTPVTDADAAVETALRRMLARYRPGDAVLGEEDGLRGDSHRRWVIDPIDGTKNFLRGMPVWATLVALETEGEVVAGMVSAPALGRRWWAARGAGAWSAAAPSRTRAAASRDAASRDAASPARRIHVSHVTELGDAFVSLSSLEGWEEQGRLPGLMELIRRAWRMRALGDFWSHVLVAEGAVDVACEPEVSHWDVAPLKVIVEEAGGRFSDLAGNASTDGGSIVCTNGPLHETVLKLLAPPGGP